MGARGSERRSSCTTTPAEKRRFCDLLFLSIWPKNVSFFASKRTLSRKILDSQIEQTWFLVSCWTVTSGWNSTPCTAGIHPICSSARITCPYPTPSEADSATGRCAGVTAQRMKLAAFVAALNSGDKDCAGYGVRAAPAADAGCCAPPPRLRLKIQKKRYFKHSKIPRDGPHSLKPKTRVAAGSICSNLLRKQKRHPKLHGHI